MSENLRVLLVLVEYEDKSHAEIAEILDWSVKAIENRICRMREQLRAVLASVRQQA